MALIQIRYHKNGTRVWNTTDPFEPSGTPKNNYRLAMLMDDSRILVGNQLIYELEQPAYPDVPFINLLPLVEHPHGHYEMEWQYVLDPTGMFYIYKQVPVFVSGVTQEECDAKLAQFKAALMQYLKIAGEWYFPIIPDTPDYIWELVDMTKMPWAGRYTQIPVEPGKYTGNKWIITYEHEALFDYFTNTYAFARTLDGSIPLLAMVKHVIKITS